MCDFFSWISRTLWTLYCAHQSPPSLRRMLFTTSWARTFWGAPLSLLPFFAGMQRSSKQLGFVLERKVWRRCDMRVQFGVAIWIEGCLGNTSITTAWLATLVPLGTSIWYFVGCETRCWGLASQSVACGWCRSQLRAAGDFKVPAHFPPPLGCLLSDFEQPWSLINGSSPSGGR